MISNMTISVIKVWSCLAPFLIKKTASLYLSIRNLLLLCMSMSLLISAGGFLIINVNKLPLESMDSVF